LKHNKNYFNKLWFNNYSKNLIFWSLFIIRVLNLYNSIKEHLPIKGKLIIEIISLAHENKLMSAI
jgi:hypothetical protein